MVSFIAQIMMLAVVCFIGYTICYSVGHKQMAQMIIMVGVMMGLLILIQEVTPVIKDLNSKIDRVEGIANKLNGGWDWPMKGSVSQEFIAGKHHGIDIAAPEGSPIKASKKGEVERAEWSDIYGNVVIISHGDGTESLYGHLSGIDVKIGYPIIAGTRIGSCGNTGKSTGPHLHFEIRENGIAQNPRSYLK